MFPFSSGWSSFPQLVLRWSQTYSKSNMVPPIKAILLAAAIAPVIALPVLPGSSPSQADLWVLCSMITFNNFVTVTLCNTTTGPSIKVMSMGLAGLYGYVQWSATDINDFTLRHTTPGWRILPYTWSNSKSEVVSPSIVQCDLSRILMISRLGATTFNLIRLRLCEYMVQS